MAGIVSAVIVLVTILKLGPLFQELPKVENLWFISERIHHHGEGHPDPALKSEGHKHLPFLCSFLFCFTHLTRPKVPSLVARQF